MEMAKLIYAAIASLDVRAIRRPTALGPAPGSTGGGRRASPHPAPDARRLVPLLAAARRRGVLRQRLWNDNRESLRNAVSRDPERSVLRWAWMQHEPQRLRYAAQADNRWVRLSTRGEVQRFLAAVESASGRARRSLTSTDNA